MILSQDIINDKFLNGIRDSSEWDSELSVKNIG